MEAHFVASVVGLHSPHQAAASSRSPAGRGVGVRVGTRIDVDKRPDPHSALRATFSRWGKESDERRSNRLGPPDVQK